MSSAVVIGASGGIGAAFVRALKEEGTFDTVHAFARGFAGSGRIDLEDEASIAAAAAIVAKGAAPTLILVATGLLHAGERGPEKAIGELDPAWLARNFAVNAIGPAIVAKHFLPLMPRDGRCVFGVLSARVGSIADNRLGGWYGYRASKAALNMLVRTLAIEEKRRNGRSIVVALHPGTVDTALSRPFQGNVAPGQLFDADRAALQLLDVIDGLKAPDSGKLFAWDGAEVAP
ncbi:SDR family NAD(P)-dependent oxidoreductase [Sphingomonas sp. NFR15]|uniref:SDR family NAD(P)-dependent oxidoreductase n=1 Tax=Sphingomonas sp. NFR15 TaxID=1566282 RepID=UPI00088D6869|nr:SDR family NAD(P)-dependent oxidoreductase [Sphingomonas sp. NFR15]SDA11896.1 NAD(P)-dependent dehydrogenase, short-chain alcohol dehydrogenase family [Sphingomonas sp. NFR15]